LRERRAVPGAQRRFHPSSLARVAFDVVIAGGGFGGLYAARRLEHPAGTDRPAASVDEQSVVLSTGERLPSGEG
jgi:ribulose 1,5-bisphosphate synthetase/thiazole synthase